MISRKFTLNEEEQQQWLTNTLTFLAPLGVIYFGFVVLTLQTPGNTFDLGDLRPTEATIGAMVLYVANSLFDLSRKFMAGRSR